ncbi:putative membrane protein [Pectobacterium atrosepticum SCRI1043]|uniref:Membrane protein n=1 Tax=Pectobacterium atrosepticum (strain SCRI 1043 / ATCC BAA-672) TaxID=218491 RepID=Q6D7S7_PECAS|nr:putative membrane protein [Pectobacterium atrosepticum SCRI1043]
MIIHNPGVKTLTLVRLILFIFTFLQSFSLLPCHRETTPRFCHSISNPPSLFTVIRVDKSDDIQGMTFDTRGTFLPKKP